MPRSDAWDASYLAGLKGNETVQELRAGLSPSEKRKYRRAVLRQMYALPKLGNGPDYRGWVPLTPGDAGIKTASSIKARAIESLLGSVLGSGVSAAGARLMYEPQPPVEWMDEHGNIFDRPMTAEEKKARRQFVAQAALFGAVGGAGMSLGASGLVGRRIAKVEREAAQEAMQDSLEPFRKLISEYKTRYNAVAMHNASNPLAKRFKKKIDVAEKLYEQQEQQVDNLVKTVSKRRAQLPFRGTLHRPDSGVIDWTQLSSAHLVDQHFDGLAKQHGHPPVFSGAPQTAKDVASAEETAKRVFEDMVSKALTKTSSAAFQAELDKVAALTKGQEAYRRKSGSYFGGEKKVAITAEEMTAYRARLKAAGLRSSPRQPGGNLSASLAKTVKGFAAHTHRARTKWYPTPEAIPLAKLKFIESTG